MLADLLPNDCDDTYSILTNTVCNGNTGKIKLIFLMTPPNMITLLAMELIIVLPATILHKLTLHSIWKD